VALISPRCDRILWKSNITPSPEQEDQTEEEQEQGRELQPPPVPPRSRMGSLLHALRPGSSRSRKTSVASFEVNPYLATSDSPQQNSPDARSGEDSPTFSFHADLMPPPRPDYLRLRHSASVDYLPSPQRPGQVRAKTYLPVLERPRSRQVSLQSNKSPLSSTFVQDSPSQSDTPPPVPPKDRLPAIAPPAMSSFLKSFSSLFRDNVSSHQEPERPSTPETPPLPQHRRGDVVCLAYNTLDDRQMRRLEGKSDHRPVIGAYALYI
jgi:hypothetical protein